MLVSEAGYNCLHEAAWTGTCTENLRHVFESGAADATGVSILTPTRGGRTISHSWYWAAASRNGAELTKLLLQYGADPEVKFQGKWRARKYRLAGERLPPVAPNGFTGNAKRRTY